MQIKENNQNNLQRQQQIYQQFQFFWRKDKKDQFSELNLLISIMNPQIIIIRNKRLMIIEII